MAVLNKIYLCCIAILLTGCIRDITPDMVMKPVLCLNSVITAGSPVEVKVSHTWLYSDVDGAENTAVDDADVLIYANGVIQKDSYIAREGDVIRIEASSPVYGYAEAEVTVPYAVARPEVVIKPEADEVNLDIYNDMSRLRVYFGMDLDVNVKDNPGKRNYYRYSMKSIYNGDSEFYCNGDTLYNYINSGYFRYETEPVFNEHVDTFEYIGGGSGAGFTFFTDSWFSDKSYTLTVGYYDARACVNTDGNLEDVLDFEVEVSIESVCEEYYKAAVFIWQLNYGVIEDLNDMGLADNVRTYSNVSSGAGLVVARSISTARVSLRDFMLACLQDACGPNGD